MKRAFAALGVVSLAVFAAGACGDDRTPFGEQNGGFVADAATDAPRCGFRCSLDGRSILQTCTGEVVETCREDQACGAGLCQEPCAAAAADRSSNGCEFFFQMPRLSPFSNPQACYAAFIVNTSTQPVDLSLELAGDALDLSKAMFRTNPGDATLIQHAGPIPPGESVILFVADRDPNVEAYRFDLSRSALAAHWYLTPAPEALSPIGAGPPVGRGCRRRKLFAFAVDIARGYVQDGAGMVQPPPSPMYPPTGHPPTGYPAPPMPAPPPKDDGEKKGWMNWELFIDKSVDFVLIFVGLYAAVALQRYQDDQKEKAEYVMLLNDFEHELQANRAQHDTIENDLGPADQQAPGVVLGPMEATFSRFMKELDADEDLVHCLHRDYAKAGGKGNAKAPHGDPKCKALYVEFEKTAAAHANGKSTSFAFEPATLSPFYRYEVWQLYLANSAKIFKNKELAVKIGEAYNNMHVIEKQVADIEATYNDAFMRQVGRAAATDAELAEIIHDEETDHALSAQDLALLLHVAESMKEERFGSLEAKSVLELKVRRMKRTVQETNKEIDALVAQVDTEVKKVTKK